MFEVRQFVLKIEGNVCAHCYSIIVPVSVHTNSTAKSSSSNMMPTIVEYIRLQQLTNGSSIYSISPIPQ